MDATYRPEIVVTQPLVAPLVVAAWEQPLLSRATFSKFDIGLFPRVHRYTRVYYIIFNCGLLTKFSLIFPKVQGYPIIWFLTFNCQPLTRVLLLFQKNFSVGPVFITLACFSILASGTHLDATITSENILRSSSIDAIIFNCGPII